ncbi:MAG: secondary thiamine-phosphate synthase enzyme YjbQ [Dehalococcoidia bacterium]|jgi:secondary thiamine-phosphate synthase enzyme|nr:secondary thiamine-phosphate synthase enzyme YjbQ [Dehalococcoidia bacterium]
MRCLTQTIRIRTQRGPQFVDITDQVMEAVREAAITNGFAVIFSRHTTAAVRINENCPHLLQDMEDMLRRLAPPEGEYRHNVYAHAFSQNGERPNGHSHCQHLLLGASEAVPVVEGKLLLGQWQRIFLVELDHGRDREVVVQLIGE